MLAQWTVGDIRDNAVVPRFSTGMQRVTPKKSNVPKFGREPEKARCYKMGEIVSYARYEQTNATSKKKCLKENLRTTSVPPIYIRTSLFNDFHGLCRTANAENEAALCGSGTCSH